MFLEGFPAAVLRGALPYLFKTDVIWCCCAADARIYQLLVENDGFQPRPIILPYGVDTDTFTPLGEATREDLRRKWGFASSDFVLVYAGRVTVKKNVHSILDVVHALRKRGLCARLVIAGRIEDVPFREFRIHRVGLKEELDKKIAAYKLSEAVMFIPWMDDMQLNELFNAADVLINLTLHHDENFGLSQIEAMSAGLPVVATAWGGLKDTIVEARTGFVADTWVSNWGIRFDMPKVIRSIEMLAASAELRQEMRHAAREHALETYSWDVCGKLYLELVDRLVESGSEPSTAHYTEFGERFHVRFSATSQESGRKRAVSPIYASFADQDYQTIIRPYTSLDSSSRVRVGGSLFRALGGTLREPFYISDDLLYTVRIPISHEEAEILQCLDRFQARECPRCLDDVIISLIDKGLVGISSVADGSNVSSC